MPTTHKQIQGLRKALARSNGFTLIEVMIVVVVVAILMAVAIPSYREYVLRSHRSSAQSFMSTVANRQAQYLLDARAYAASVAALGLTVPADVAQHYNVSTSPVAGTPPGFTVVAAPIGAQAADRCGQMTINHTGLRSASAVNASVQCW